MASNVLSIILLSLRFLPDKTIVRLDLCRLEEYIEKIYNIIAASQRI